MKRYDNENDFLAVVEAFENGTISREHWRHAEHLTVALYYLENYDFDSALVKMRDGIFSLLRSFAVDLTEEMPYHETLTVFWLKTVDDFRQSKSECSTVEIGNKIIERFDKDYPLKFYSRELLFSDEAKKIFIEGDLTAD